jgi:hypothetical protein
VHREKFNIAPGDTASAGFWLAFLLNDKRTRSVHRFWQTVADNKEIYQSEGKGKYLNRAARFC